MFAEVIVSRVSKGLDKTFHYSIPSGLDVKIGHEVVIPFGKRETIGYVVGLVESTDIKGIKEIKNIKREAPLFGQRELELARWMAEYYCSTLGAALQLFLPPKGQAPSTKYQIPNNIQITNSKKLNAEQERAWQEIGGAKGHEVFLLDGAAGSGKTEVCLAAAAEEIKKSRSVLILTPEISQLSQLEERAKQVFPEELLKISSDLTDKEKREAWWRVKRGEIKLVLGTRLALFLPFKDLGLIVVEDEFENTYKSDMSPRYHARETAIKLGELHWAKVVLSTATPAIETCYLAKKGTYQLLHLSQRIDRRPAPEVQIIDMAREKGLLSAKLKQALKDTLDKKEQAILFINRRGFFTFVMCQECGKTLECPKCSVSLVYHSSKKKLLCQHCGFSIDAPLICSNCHSSKIVYYGTGTQRIEQEVGRLLPNARILRWDRDAVSKRGSSQALFDAFSAGKADVLIGTQMVAKGMDVANVTLVGVISADTSLYFPDFRAAEHTFQLLTQVAGRAGRHHIPGKVIIQTLNPDHYAIKAAQKHDYEGFYQSEIQHRQELGYPPFSKLISVMLAGPSAEKTAKIATNLSQFINRRIETGVLGPALAAIPKLRSLWRYQILLKGADLSKMRQSLLESLDKTIVPKEIRVTIDIEPMNMI